MNEITTKARIRLKAEIMPLHWCIAPEDAPDCYGDVNRRCFSWGCLCCFFRDHCADFVDNGGPEATCGMEETDALRLRAVWPAAAPLVLDYDRFHECIAEFYERPPSVAGRRLMAFVFQEHDGIEIAMASINAHGGGLIGVDAAIEIAEHGGAFYHFLEAENPHRRWVKDTYMTALVWVTAAVTRRALRWQGRPNAFAAWLHHQVWEAITDEKLSRNALRKRRSTVDGLYRHFEYRRCAGF